MSREKINLKTMKKYFITAAILLSFGAVKAQIGEIKQEGSGNGYLKIYDESGKYNGIFISLCSNCEFIGNNSKYILIKEGSGSGYVKIYDENGKYTGIFISLCSKCQVKNVTSTAILISEGSITKYYDFTGKYTGKYTQN
jgi:hypothetical protein